MSPVQASGGRGSGQGQGSPGGKPGSSGKKPTSAKITTAPSKGKRPPSKSGPSGGGGKGKTGKTISAPPPSRFSPSTMAFVAIGLVVVIILVFVVVKVVGGGTSSTSGAPTETPATATVVSAVTGATTAMANQVGVPSSVQVPKVAQNQPVLMINGKPAVLFIGGLFCPYCAAERWAIVLGLSPFGSWSGLQETTSSPWDTDPATATFAFNGATFTSDTITLVTREAEGNDTTGPGTRKPLEQLTSQESGLWAKYSAQFGLSGEGFPFLDIGNKVFVVSPSYDPAILAGLTQADIAAKLTNPNDPVTQAIFGTANYIRAGVCSVTGQQPTTVCSQSGVKAASQAMGLS
jgi:Domain of unknown function (DUF929)